MNRMVKIVFIVSVLLACWAQVQGDADLDAAWNNYLVNIDNIFIKTTFDMGAVNYFQTDFCRILGSLLDGVTHYQT